MARPRHQGAEADGSGPQDRPSTALRRLLDGYRVTQAISVAATLGIADLLVDGPRANGDLAAATGTHDPTLYRLLRALAAIGVLEEQRHRRFALTPLGEALRSDAPDSIAPWAAYLGEPYHWSAWGAILHSVRTGENAFQHVHGMDTWAFRAEHPELSAGFDRAMASLSRHVADAVLASFDFGRFQTIVDVGGGTGALLAAILAACPGARGVLFDQPHVVSDAPPVLRRAGITDRCEVVGGSFFDEVPAGGDAYLLKSILHDWEDEQCGKILGVCRRAMADHAAVLVVERDLGPANERPDAKLSDLNMLVGPGGRERSTDEYAALFAAAGFRFVGVTPSPVGVSVYEAMPT